MAHFILKMRLENWLGRLLGRSEEQIVWRGASMARPVSHGIGGRAYNPRPAASLSRRAGGGRNPARRISPVVWLSIGFGVVLVAIIVVCIGLIAQAFWPDPVAAPSSYVAPPVTPAPTPIPGDPVKILLLGSDQRPDDPGYRTDVMMMLQIDPKTQSVSVVSFPRDLWVTLPHDAMKINMVMQYGGFDVVAQMFQDNFGVRPDYYVLTNFSGFTTMVDSQGGVDVQIASDLTDECSLPGRVNGNCSVKAGTVHMDGPTALWYVRSRHSSSDFDRLRRAQEVLYAALKKMCANGCVDKLPSLQSALKDNVKTNLSLDKALTFLPVALAVLQSPDKIKRFAIGEEQTTESISWNGMWILLQNPGAIPELLKEAGIK